MPDTRVNLLLQAHRDGPESVRPQLLEHAYERLRHLAGKMFRGWSDVRRLYETDDVLSRALTRLHKALESVKPDNARQFFGLAARQIRWVLRDMATEAAGNREIMGLEKDGPRSSKPRLEAVDPETPDNLSEWSNFHEIIDKLPEDAREMFDLLFYQGLSQDEAAETLGCSVRTVKRRWQQARLLLDTAQGGQYPKLG